MFVLYTDTDCDVTPAIAKEYGYKLISMPYSIGDTTYYPHVTENEPNSKDFYDTLRKGIVPKTSAVNPYEYINYFEPEFQKGNDILYVHFSKEMSGTFNALSIALAELKDKYPERTCHLLDTETISLGGLYAAREIGKLYKEGKSIEEIYAWAENNLQKIALYFFASDLKFFQKSGRVNGLSAFFGSLIGIHPIIYMNQEGKLVTLTTVRGKHMAIKKLVNFVNELGDDVKNHQFIIGHCDALEIAEKLGEALKAELGQDLNIEDVAINHTVGSHCGPSTVGVCFNAIHR